jgi:hypothetical protein
MESIKKNHKKMLRYVEKKYVNRKQDAIQENIQSL